LKPNRSSFIDLIGVILALTGTTCLMAGVVAFAVAGGWKNSFSLTFVPAGAVLLIGGGLIKWRLAALLMLPVGVLAAAMGGILWSKAVASPVEGVGTAQFIVLTCIGIGLLAASVALSLPALLSSSRRGMVGANVVAMSLIGLGIVVVVNYLGSLYYHQRDLTNVGRFTLSGKTISILENLEKDVEITVILPPGQLGVYGIPIDLHSPTKRMLEDFARISDGKVKVNYIDPMHEKSIEDFFSKNMDCEQTLSVVFRTSKASRQVKLQDLIKDMDPYARMRGEEMNPKFAGESAFASALLKVTDEKKPVIYFTGGKGELPLKQGSGREASMSILGDHIRKDNYELKTINIATDGIPDDCDILAIVRPKHAFSQTELDLIEDYLDSSGKLLVALEPEFTKVPPTGLERLLAERNIRVRSDALAIGRGGGIFGQELSYQIHAQHPPHEITEKLGNVVTMFHVSGAIEPIAPQPGPQGQPLPARFNAATIAATSDDGWGELNQLGQERMEYNTGIDISGPVSLAVAATENDPNMPPPNPYGPPPKPDPNFNGARIVALADGDVLSNGAVTRGPGNIDFALNCVNWLAKKTERLDIGAKDFFAKPMAIEPDEQSAIFLATLFGLPYLVLVVGGIVYWRRSN